MTKLIMSIGLYMARMYSIINQVIELSSWSLKCRAIIQFPHDHSFWVTVAHGECEQVLQIIVCQCYLKLFARTRECFARLVVLASSTRIYYILKPPFWKGAPSPAVGLLAWTHHGMERRIAHFSSPTCMTQPAFMDMIPNSINGAFQGNDTSQWFHSAQSYSLFASPKRSVLYDLANWKTGTCKLRYNKTIRRSGSEKDLVDVTGFEVYFYFLGL